MVEGLLARKIGMVQLFDKDGRLVAGTIMETGPCTVVQLKDDESGNCRAVQLGFQDVKERKLTKPVAGHFRKKGVPPKKYLKERQN